MNHDLNLSDDVLEWLNESLGNNADSSEDTESSDNANGQNKDLGEMPEKIIFDDTLIDNPESDPNIGLFTIRTANQVISEAKNRPKPSKLFGQLWWEHEICILFSDSNLGKSILAVQIADGISKGKKVMGLGMEAKPQPVLYCDFELSDKQFEQRYVSDNGDNYIFSDNLLRVEINPDIVEYPEDMTFEEYVKDSLEKVVLEKNVKIIVVDNITYLSQQTEQAKDALPLMQWLKAFGRKYKLSILVLAHTPKRNPCNPITKNDLQGSKMLYNFCDGCFAIGESAKDNRIRYIKELKQRNDSFMYDSENVIVCEVIKPDNFLQFRFIGYSSESEHLKQFDEMERLSLIDKCKALKSQGKPYREIAQTLGISVGSVSNYLNK